MIKCLECLRYGLYQPKELQERTTFEPASGISVFLTAEIVSKSQKW